MDDGKILAITGYFLFKRNEELINDWFNYWKYGPITVVMGELVVPEDEVMYGEDPTGWGPSDCVNIGAYTVEDDILSGWEAFEFVDWVRRQD